MTSSFFQRDPKRWRVAFTDSQANHLFGGSQQRGSVTADEAYLVVHGPQEMWRNVFRMEPGKTMSVGRDVVNRLVVDDDRCSRRHCEFFFEAGQWFLRDLNSRNGTLLNGKKVHGDNVLNNGDRVRIGNTLLLFTTDLLSPMSANAAEAEGTDDESDDDSDEDAAGDAERGAAALHRRDEASSRIKLPLDEPQILDRKARTGYISGSGLSSLAESNLREAFGLLCELITRLVAAPDVKSLAHTVLQGLVSAVKADIGAVLLFPDPLSETLSPDQLRLVEYLSPDNRPYQVVSQRLSAIVLAEREAVLAVDIRGASGEHDLQTLGKIEAESVICAPIRHDDALYGLLHLYSLDPRRSLDANALDLTLAVADQVAIALENLAERESLATGLQLAFDENRSLRRLLEIESELVGDSRPMLVLRDTIARVAASDATALVRGESGVGKELVARAIHFNGARRDGPFVCLNCAALTESLLESELFGHERGSFTGATERKIGKFEQADGGTLFLDEVGEMPLSTQVKFLRVLEGHPFERVGGSVPITADVRVVAATNRNLEAAVEANRFRRDLFFRLQILEIDVPALREHPTDIPLLAEHFLQRSAQRMGRQGLRFSKGCMQLLCQYDWPGNVRELRNVIERAVVLAEGVVLEPSDIRFSSLPNASEAPAAERAFEPVPLEALEREHIERVMEWAEGNKRETARLLGINRSTLDRKLERYGIRAPRDSAP